MKSLLILLVIILSSFSASASDYGFNGLEWGSPPKPSMNLLDSRGSFKFYSDDLDKVNKDLIAYGIEGVVYGFCNSRFCELFGRVKGRDNFYKIMIGISGERGYPNINKHVTIWFAQVDILIYFEEETETGYFLFYNNPIHLALAKEKKINSKAEKETRYLQKKKNR